MAVRRLPTLAALVVGVTVGSFAGVVASPAAAAPVGNFGQYTAGTYTWTVPDGVNAAVFNLYGATGGGGAPGGHLQAALGVIPGETYTLVVGGQGGHAASSDINGARGGANGGGAGGDGNGLGSAGSGGGGGTDVRIGSGLDSRLLVAGGGGGAGFAAGGGPGGADVGGSAPRDPTFNTPATGGTQTAGGQGAVQINVQAPDGAFGVGGAGLQAPNGGGGGGGGGWYGGGGGSGASGGGGGSNYATVNAFDVVSEQGVPLPSTAGSTGDGAIIVSFGQVDPPTFTAATPPSGTVGQPYSYTFTATGWPAPELHLQGTLPDGLSFGADGTLSGTPTGDGTFPLTLQALTPAGNVDAAVSLVIAPVQTAAGISGTPPPGTVGTGYDFAYTVAGAPPPTTTVTTGSTPPGVTLSADGRLTGTPTQAGSWTFTVQAANSAGTASVDSTIDVAATVPGAPTIDTAAPGDGSATVTFTPPSSDGGSPITGFTATATPAAAGPAPVTATGTGSPLTIAGLTDGVAYTVTVAATNGVGTGPASAPSDSLTPVAPLQITTAGALPGGTVGQAYAASLTATGGLGSYSWSLVPGSALPDGLTLQPDGTISGTPTTDGTTDFAVQVSDQEPTPQAVQQQLSLTIAPPLPPDLAISLGAVTPLVHGRPGQYRVTVTNTGGSATSRPILVAVNLGRGVVAQGADAPGWSCAFRGQVCLYRGSLPSGQSVGFVLAVRVLAPAGQQATSVAFVAPPDRTLSDNADRTSLTVQDQP